MERPRTAERLPDAFETEELVGPRTGGGARRTLRQGAAANDGTPRSGEIEE
jgi:hypothetical protein